MLVDSRFLTLRSYLHRMYIHTWQLILMQLFFVIVKRCCLKLVLLKKWELLEVPVIKRCPKLFSTIPNSSYLRKYVLIRLTTYHWQSYFSQFCDITKSVLQISTGSLDLQVPVIIAKFSDLVVARLLTASSWLSHSEFARFLFNDSQPKIIGFRVSTSNLGHLDG